MRYLLYDAAQPTIELRKEIEFINSFISLMQLRHSEEVEITLVIPWQIPEVKIPPMLFISLLENAFKHGVGMVQNPSIDIELNDDKKSLFFSVRNQVSKQNSEIKDESSGIGLANVRRRLELLYPDQHELKIDEKEDSYLVELTIKHI